MNRWISAATRCSNRGGLSEVKPSRELIALFAELAFPFVSESNATPGVNSLMLTLAGRWEEYSIKGDFGDPSVSEAKFDEFSPKVGLAWEPVAGFKIRGTWGSSFRAPSLTDLFTVATPPFPSFFIDPIDPLGRPIVPALFQLAGNPELQPETGDTYTVGFDWDSESIEGLRISASYVKVEFDDRIAGLADLLALQSEILANSDQFPDIVTRNPDGTLFSVTFRPINIASRSSESVDLSIQHTLETARGTVDYGASATWTLELEDLVLPSGDPVQRHETSLGPDRLVARGFVNWSNDPWGVTASVNYRSSYDLAGLFASNTPRIDGFTTFDVSTYYETSNASGWMDGIRFLLGARNLFDADVPFVDQFNGPFDPSRIDLRRRVVYAEVRKEF